MLFYLGTHIPHWLWKVDVPLFVSRRRLEGRKSFGRALARWCLDSGGYSELNMHGEWQTSEDLYVEECNRYATEIGNLDWVAPQDWLCEESILQKTGLSVKTHQVRTIDSFVSLRSRLGSIQVIPVLQGYKLFDYFEHARMYQQRCISLEDEPVVGVGSLSRRQRTMEGAEIVKALAGLNLRLHGFGFKFTGLERVGNKLVSTDSMAWSFAARMSPPLPGHTHKSCKHCVEYALLWRAKLLGRVGRCE